MRQNDRLDVAVFGDQMGSIVLVCEGIQVEEVTLSFLQIDEFDLV